MGVKQGLGLWTSQACSFDVGPLEFYVRVTVRRNKFLYNKTN